MLASQTDWSEVQDWFCESRRKAAQVAHRRSQRFERRCLSAATGSTGMCSGVAQSRKPRVNRNTSESIIAVDDLSVIAHVADEELSVSHNASRQQRRVDACGSLDATAGHQEEPSQRRFRPPSSLVASSRHRMRHHLDNFSEVIERYRNEIRQRSENIAELEEALESVKIKPLSSSNCFDDDDAAAAVPRRAASVEVPQRLYPGPYERYLHKSSNSILHSEAAASGALNSPSLAATSGVEVSAVSRSRKLEVDEQRESATRLSGPELHARTKLQPIDRTVKINHTPQEAALSKTLSGEDIMRRQLRAGSRLGVDDPLMRRQRQAERLKQAVKDARKFFRALPDRHIKDVCARNYDAVYRHAENRRKAEEKALRAIHVSVVVGSRTSPLSKHAAAAVGERLSTESDASRQRRETLEAQYAQNYQKLASTMAPRRTEAEKECLFSHLNKGLDFHWRKE